MNQEKIGRFIYNCRKEKGLTQSDLASLLNVSNKAVSKWENGYSLPDYSLLIPLCEIFECSVNDLLGGEKSNNLNEVNTINAIKHYRGEGINKWKKIFLSFFITIIILLLIVYLMTNFGKNRIYAIKSDSQEFIVQGYVISNQKQNIFTLSRLEYIVDYNVFCINGDYDCEDIKIRNLNVYLFDGVDKVSEFEVEKNNKDLTTLSTLLKDVTLDINNEENFFNINDNNLRLIISYENEKYQNINIELKLNLEKIYENNRFFY